MSRRCHRDVFLQGTNHNSFYSTVAMVSSHLQFERSMAYRLPCSSQIINEMLHEIHTMQKSDFLKLIIILK